ncbi:unnamed protein product [Coffea canephora]|uniref:non-specific serine/threonine protein kinase n=1 Tax=Coffea canephora TaxID=49390 RepID=A0A068UBQ7_COFCA|nr:unnamed protein product [Coffea canephora]
MAMLVFGFICLSFLARAEIAAGQDDCLPASNPLRVKLGINDIDYKSQVLSSDRMNVHDCLPRQLPHVNSPASPFGVVTVFSTGGGFSLFNCSTSANNGSDSRNGWPIPCLSTPDFQVRYLDSGFEQYNQTYNYVLLNWSKPSCANCEANGKHCRLKINGANNETECVDIPRQPGDGTYLRHTFPYVVIQIKIRIRHQFSSPSVVCHFNIEKKKERGAVYKALRPIRFYYADIKKITDQFKEKLRLWNSGNGEEFINEAGTIGRIHHINVVRLVGFWADGCTRALVYEFLPNDSLEKFISRGKQLLRWEKLEQIAIGIAKGLDYLHQGCNQRILHFDIEPHNILLDQNFSPKVADFGLAKLIYSFGMSLLDMVGARKNFRDGADDSSQIYYPEWMDNQLEKGENIAIQTDDEQHNTLTYSRN